MPGGQKSSGRRPKENNTRRAKRNISKNGPGRRPIAGTCKVGNEGDCSPGTYCEDSKGLRVGNEGICVRLSPTACEKGVAIAAGYWHTCALQANGTVHCWGSNEEGQSNVPGGLKAAVQTAGQLVISPASEHVSPLSQP